MSSTEQPLGTDQVDCGAVLCRDQREIYTPNTLTFVLSRLINNIFFETWRDEFINKKFTGLIIAARRAGETPSRCVSHFSSETGALAVPGTLHQLTDETTVC